MNEMVVLWFVFFYQNVLCGVSWRPPSPGFINDPHPQTHSTGSCSNTGQSIHYILIIIFVYQAQNYVRWQVK